MTSEKKAGWTAGITIASIAAVLGLWPHAMPILDWLAPIFARDQVQAVLAALAGGGLLGVPLPHLMPRTWTPARTLVVTGLACALLAFSVALALVPTRVGFVYAVLAAVATPTVSRAIAGAWYALRPAARPESLQP